MASLEGANTGKKEQFAKTFHFNAFSISMKQEEKCIVLSGSVLRFNGFS